MDLSNVIRANRIRIVNVELAVFNRIFLHGSSLKSTFAQNKSCRGRKDLQHWYWIKVVLINDLRDKIGSKEDQS